MRRREFIRRFSCASAAWPVDVRGHRLITTRGPSMGDSPEAIPSRLCAGLRSTLLAAKSIAYSDSGSGTYLSTTLFPKLGIADQVVSKSRKVREPPSGEPVAAVVARGEAEIGFQQVSELIHVPGIHFVGTIPTELQPKTSFAGALTSTVRQPEAGSALVRFLTRLRRRR